MEFRKQICLQMEKYRNLKKKPLNGQKVVRKNNFKVFKSLLMSANS